MILNMGCMKTCKICLQFKDFSDFYFIKQHNSYHSYCKDCLKFRHQENYIKRLKLKSRICRICNIEKPLRTNFGEYASLTCSECTSKGLHMPLPLNKGDFWICNKCSQVKPKEKFEYHKKGGRRRSTCRACRLTEKKKESIKKAHKSYCKTENGQLIRKLQKIKYNAKKRTVSDGSVTRVFIRGLEKITKKCPMCNIKLTTYHIDHVIPLSKGGHHTASNIQLLCPECNIKKSDHILHLC